MLQPHELREGALWTEPAVIDNCELTFATIDPVKNATKS